MHRVAMADVGGRTLGAVIREKDEELALFLQMRRRRDHEEADLLLLDDAAGDDGLLLLDPPPPPAEPKAAPAAPAPAGAYRMGAGFRRAPGGADDFLHSDAGDKNDYDWLLTPPGTPLFPSHEAAPKRSPVSQTGSPKTRQAALKSRLANHQDPPSRTTHPLRTASSNSLNSAATTRRPSSSGGLTSNSSRPSTPTGRAASTVTSKGSRPSTPNSRATLPAKTGLTAPRSSTPTSRSALPSARSTQPPARSTQPPARSTQPPARSTTPSRTSSSASATRTSVPPGRASAPASRSSTPTSRSSMPATRSTTPLSRPSLPAQSKPASRSSTPTRRSSAPATTATQHGNLPGPVRSSSISRPGPTMPRTSASAAPAPSRGSSPTIKSRPWKPSEMPGFSLDAPPNLRTSLPERPTSATRGRPGAPSSRSSSVEPGPAARPKRQSCSPSRGRASNGSVPSGSSMPAVRRSHLNGVDSVNPVQMGNKMVERVVNMIGDVLNRGDLLKVAAAGPVAGYTLGFGLLLLGFTLPPSDGLGIIVDPAVFHQSFLLGTIAKLILGDVLKEGTQLSINPLVLWAWAGLLINAINSIPAGELDGGRIAFAMWGRKISSRLSSLTIGLLGLSSLFSDVAFYFVVLIFFLQRGPVAPLSDPNIPSQNCQWLEY